MLAKTLKKRGHKLDVLDHNVSIKEFKKQHDLNIIKFPPKKFYDAVLITVAHKEFKMLKKNYFLSLLEDKKKGVIFDLKNIFNNNFFSSL